MGTLTQFLQSSFREHCPDGWTCKPEALVIHPRLEKWLGYSPRADVCLTSDDGCQRMWVEFEISRADPVANHVKFATSHLFEPLGTNDHFISMVSSHVTRGRRNLASNTIHLLRRVGMSAFQTVLLPTIAPPEIQRLNHLPVTKIYDARLDVPAEIARLFQVVQPVVATRAGHRVHFASELFDVIRNVAQWNNQVNLTDGAKLWKRRSITYFVYDPVSTLFAPSKFCAYVVPETMHATAAITQAGLMDLELYCQLDESDPRFDGHRARNHLTSNLGMRILAAEQLTNVGNGFATWLSEHAELISVHPAGAQFIVPPDWYS